MVFSYRPKFDGGGSKWPQLHHIIISSLLLGQFITAVSFALKGNIIQGLVIAFCVVPTLMYNSIILEKFTRHFRDASLMQTSKVDSVDQAKEEGRDSWLKREEFRR